MVKICLKVLLNLIGALLLLIVVPLALLALRLQNGPLQVDFLLDWMEEEIAQHVAPFSIAADGVQLAWGGADAPLDLQVTGIGLFHHAAPNPDQPLFSIPVLSATLSGSRLLDGDPALSSVTVQGLTVSLVRDADGSLHFADSGLALASLTGEAVNRDGGQDGGRIGGDSGAGQSLIPGPQSPPVLATGPTDLPDQSSWMGHLDAGLFGLWRQTGGILRDATFVDTTLSFQDAASEARWHFEQASVDLDVMGSPMDLQISGLLRVEPLFDRAGWRPIGPLPLDAVVQLHRQDRRLDLASTAGAIEMAAFAHWLPEDIPVIRLPLAATLTAGLDLSQPTTAPWEALLDAAALTVNAEAPGRVTLPEPIDQTPEVETLELSLAVGPKLESLSLNHFKMDLDGVLLVASGDVTTPLTAPGIRMALGVTDLPVEGLKRLWPKTVAKGGRKWVIENLADGSARQGDFAFALSGQSWDALDLDDLSGTVLADGMTVHYRKPLPPVRDVEGEVRFYPDRIEIDGYAGHIGPVSVAEAKVVFTDLGGDEQADIFVRAEGPAAAALDIIDHEPLGYASRVGVDPASVAGETVVDLQFDFPLRADLTFDDVQLDVSGTLTEIGIPDVLFGNALSEGAFTLTLDEEGLDMVGTAALGGVSAGIAWRENFGDAAAINRQYRVRAALDNDQRARFRLSAAPFQPPFMDGVAEGNVVYTEKANGESVLDATMDLTALRFSLDAMDWVKPVGAAAQTQAQAVFHAAQKGGGADIHFTVDGVAPLPGGAGPGLSGQGRVTLVGPDLDFHRADFAQVRHGASQLSGSLTLDVDGSVLVDIAAGDFDARAFTDLGDTTEGTPTALLPQDAAPPLVQDPAAPDVVVSFALERVQLTEGISLQPAQGRLAFRGDGESKRLEQADVGGTLVGGNPLHFVLGSSGGEDRTFSLSTGNGGAVFRALDVTDRIRGGRMAVSGTIDATGGAKGQLTLDDFRLVDAPVAAQVLSVAGLTGILDVLGGEGIDFQRADVPFERQGPILRFLEARAWGSAIGLRVSGQLDLKAETLDLSGALAPARAINDVLEAIPVLGTLMTGIEGDGFIALNFAATGPTENPSVSVNPLSAITPGLLRDLFGGLTTAAPVPEGSEGAVEAPTGGDRQTDQ